MSVCRRLATLATATACALAAPALVAEEVAQVHVNATLAPDPVGIGELALLTVTVESGGLRLPELEPEFELGNLELTGPPSTARSHSWVNGATQSKLELTWRLRPLAAGKAAEVRSIRFEMGGQTRVVGNLSVAVVDQAPERRRGQRPATPLDPFGGLFGEGGNDPFAPFRRPGGPALPGVAPIVRLRSEATPARVYVGQQTVWRLAVETQTDIASLNLREQPDFAGFWSRALELPERPPQQDVEIEGQRGARFPIASRALFPLREGTYRIGPARAQVAARAVGNGLFGLVGRDVARDLESAPATVVVRPLPPGAPPGFSGLVGRLSVDSELVPERVEAGAAATLRIRISGDANFEGAPAPELRLPPGLRPFPPQRELVEKPAGDRLQSDLTWSFVLVADRTGSYPLPPVRVTSFDPVAAAYRTVETAPGTLEVVPSTGAPPTPVAAEPLARPAAAAAPAQLLASPGVHLALRGGLLLAALAGLGVAVSRLRERPGSPSAQLRARIDAARAIEAPREAAKALDEAWRAHLEGRFGLARSLPVAQWPAQLGSLGVAAEAVEELVALFEDLHLLAFAPELADAEALREDLQRRSRALVRRLR